MEPDNHNSTETLPADPAAIRFREVNQLLDQAWEMIGKDLFQSEILLDQAHRLAEGLQNDSLTLRLLACQCELHFQQGELSACLQTARDAQKHKGHKDWRHFEAIFLTNTARAHAKMGDYAEALEIFQEQHRAAVRDGNSGLEASSLNNMALIYCSTGDLEAANQHFQHALEINQRIAFPKGECFVRNNLAMFPQEGGLDEALEHGRKALVLARDLQILNLELMVLDTLGNLHLKRNEIQEARAVLNEALNRAGGQTEDRLLVPLRLTMARMHAQAGSWSDALAQLDLAQPHMEIHRMEPERIKGHLLRSQVNEKLGRHQEALLELKRHVELQELVVGLAKQQQVKRLRDQYETEARRQEADSLRRRADELEVLGTLGREIAASLDMQTVLERINETAKRLVGGCDAAIYLRQPDGKHLRAIATSGENVRFLKNVLVPIESSLAGAVCLSRGAEVANSLREDPRVLLLNTAENCPAVDPSRFAILASALCHGEESLGAILVWRIRQEAGDFSQAELGVLTALAPGAAIAIHHASLFQELNQAKKAAEEALLQVKTLRGLVPICAGCKSIRDDEGFWHNVSDYLRDHTEAECSHGLCPACLRALYPEMIPPGSDSPRPD